MLNFVSEFCRSYRKSTALNHLPVQNNVLAIIYFIEVLELIFSCATSSCGIEIRCICCASPQKSMHNSQCHRYRTLCWSTKQEPSSKDFHWSYVIFHCAHWQDVDNVTVQENLVGCYKVNKNNHYCSEICSNIFLGASLDRIHSLVLLFMIALNISEMHR